jgi:hypothetical protein
MILANPESAHDEGSFGPDEEAKDELPFHIPQA